MEQIIRIGMDTSKSVFQLHGVNASEHTVLRKKLSRREMVKFFEKTPPTTIALEACGGSHHWARLLRSFGHEVKLIAPQLAKPYVKRGKNDAADAEALCEAMSRPTMRFVPVKSANQQAALMLVGVRERLIRNRTQLANAIRGFAMEFGIVAAKGMCRIEPLLERIAADQSLPELARELFAMHGQEYRDLLAETKTIDEKLMELHRADECSKRLAEIPGVGAIARLGVITRAGDEILRSILVVGATALLQHVRTGRSRHASRWLVDLLQRKKPKLVAVALANKIARIAWKLMVSGETYQRPKEQIQAV
ncbi:IS110 family transposase [Ensifer sp. ENS04]|uniref:IS110 family transposase n=1 Tax=Ensifer sp. ENS04 TaxID=2769281 RepID=UPI00177D57C8|nr:IS110 family transposase [Ensifer sp. ENS04]